MIEDKKINSIGVIQNIFLENREKLNISGVKDVLSFDDQMVIVETELGMLTIKGENLRINKLSLDTSEVSVDGLVNNIIYSDNIKDGGKKGVSFLGKIFK
jgi:sporulation protein YabP